MAKKPPKKPLIDPEAEERLRKRLKEGMPNLTDAQLDKMVRIFRKTLRPYLRRAARRRAEKNSLH